MSKVQICNEALQNIGADDYITSLTEDTPNAIECNLRYDTARKALLRMHPWNFAIKRASLNKEVATPAFNFANQFTLPSDFIKVIMTGLEERYSSSYAQPTNETFEISNVPNRLGPDNYKIEGRKLVTDSATVQLVYVSDIEDTAQFDAAFTQLLARYLGGLIAYKVVGSKTERDEQFKIFKEELAEYQSIDSQEGIIDSIITSEYLAAGY